MWVYESLHVELIAGSMLNDLVFQLFQGTALTDMSPDQVNGVILGSRDPTHL